MLLSSVIRSVRLRAGKHSDSSREAAAAYLVKSTSTPGKLSYFYLPSESAMEYTSS